MLKHKGGDVLPVHGDWHPVSIVQGRKSRNLWNVNALELNHFLNEAGASVPASGYNVSEFIKVKPNTEYFISNRQSSRTKYYDANKVPLSNTWDTPTSADTRFTTPIDCEWVRVTNNATQTPLVMFAESHDVLEYEPYIVTTPIYTPAESTKSGTELEFERAYNDAAEVGVEGKSEQVQLSGKNLLNIHRTEVITQSNKEGYAYDKSQNRPFSESQVWPGLTMNNYFGQIGSYSIGENSVTVNVKNPGYGLAFPVKVSPNTAYVFKTDDESLVMGYGFFKGNGEFISFTQVNQGRAITTPADAGWMTIVFRPDNYNEDKTYNNPQLELGSTATEYEPYCGGIPSPNPDYPQPIQSIEGVEVSSRGRNLLPEKFVERVSNGVVFTIKPDGTYHASGTSTGSVVSSLVGSSAWVPCNIPAGTYTISGMGGSSSKFGFNFAFKDKDGVTFVDRTRYVTDTFILEKDARQIYCSLRAQAGVVLDDDIKPMIVPGSTAHPYEPYHSSTRTIDLQGHELRSLPDGTHDELLVHRDGSVELVQRVYSLDVSAVSWGKYQSETTPFWYQYIYDRPNVADEIIEGNSKMSTFGIRDIRWYSGNKQVRLYMRSGTVLGDLTSGEVNIPLLEPQTIQLPSIEPLPTFHPYTFIDGNGVDLTARVRVIE